MVQPPQSRHLFPGSNTPLGYRSLYHYVLPHGQATRIWIIKGGPGTGKSTFMKRLAHEVTEKIPDVSVEYHHCSADPGSLDAVVLGGRIAMIDGTTPHAIEPKFPGAVDEILHFGQFWDADAIAQNRSAIMELTVEKQQAFNRAFSYLKAARAIQEQIDHIHSSRMHFGPLSRLAPGIIGQWLTPSPPRPKSSRQARRARRLNVAAAESPPPIQGAQHDLETGRERHLFGRAITPDGLVDHLENVMSQTKYRIVIHGPSGTGKSTLVRRIVDAAVAWGYDVECFRSPMVPDKIEHVIISGADLSITTTEQLEGWHAGSDLTIHTTDYMRPANDHEKGALLRAQELFQRNLEAAVQTLIEAKSLHAEIETLYTPHMDFERLDELFRQISSDCIRLIRYTG